MDELIAFLRARYDEREAAALAANEGPWTSTVPSLWIDAPGVGIIVQTRHFEDTAHIVLHDPAAVLRDIAGKRKIVDMAEQQPGWYPADARSESERHWDEAAQQMMAEVLHHLAGEFASHPDYNARMWGPLTSGNPVPEVNPGG